MPSEKLDPQPRIDFNTASMTTSFQLMGTIGRPAQILKMVSDANISVDVRFFNDDAVTSNDFLPAGGSFVLDVNTNSDGGASSMPGNTKIYVKSAAGAGVGNIYAVYYS
jgi:hypothetical protein